MRTKLAASACFSLLMGGCVTLPTDVTSNGIGGGVTPKMVVDTISRELCSLDDFDKLAAAKWVATADLTLQVDDELNLTPSFTHTSVVAAGVSHLFDWGIKFDTQAQRVFNESVTFNFSDLKTKSWCRPAPKQDADHHGIMLTGDLGLNDTVNWALAAGQLDKSGKQFEPTPPPSNTFRALKAQAGAGQKQQSPFGTTIQFIVTKNLNGLGPTWKLVYFSGPGKLFMTQRINTNKLIISFAANAADAQDRVTQMTLGTLSTAITNLQLRSP